MSTANIALDVTQYVRINVGFNPLIIQAHRDSVRIAFSNDKPALANTSFHILHESNENPFKVPFIDSNVWVLATTETSSLTVTEVGDGLNNTTAFGDLKTESMTPITQISAEYGLIGQVITGITTSGTTTVVDNKFTCQTGVDATGLASIMTLRHLSYKPGQGAVARFTAVFTPGVADSFQGAGLITDENSFIFAYASAAFGILHSHDGKSESQELTITTPASGAESATIGIDGSSFIVPLTAGTVQHNAFEIANSLDTQVANFRFTSNDDQVVSQSLLPAPQVAYTFTSATAVAAWVQVVAGVASTVEFTPQSNWNIDTRLSGPSSRILDQIKGNVYQIQYQYLGFGAIKFFVEDRDSGNFVLVHIIKFANINTVPSVSNPSFRVGWVAHNTGNTTNLIVAGGSASGFVEGLLKRGTPPRSEDNEQLAVGTVLTNVITFRNRITFGNKVNRVEILPLLASLSSQTNKSAFFEVRANPVFTGTDLDFSYIDKDNSVMEIATDAATVTGGRLVGAVTVSAGSSETINFNTRSEETFVTIPGQIFSIAARVSSGAAADMQVTGSWTEDI